MVGPGVYLIIWKASPGALTESERQTGLQSAARQAKPVPGAGSTLPVMDLSLDKRDCSEYSSSLSWFF